MPEQKTFVTVKIDEKEIQEKSKIYDTSKIDPHHKMFSYYTELNRAALKLALDDPSIVNDKQNLCNLARQMLHNSGYNYKKKTTRSKQFGESAGAQKREYISDSLKVKRLQEIQEDLTDTDTQMGLLTRQREKHVNVKQFGQAATLTEQISQLREKKRKLQEELTMLQTKKRKCEKQNAKTKSLNASHAKITRFLPQVSNKKPEHVDGQQPTVVGPLVAKITPNSSCRLPDPSDALRHGMGSVEAAKKTCTPSASSSCIQLDPPDALQQGMGSVLDPPDGLEQGMGSVEAAKKTCTPSASSSCIQLDPLMPSNKAWAPYWTPLMASNKAWALLKQQRKPVHHQLNNQTPLMAFNMPWNQMRHPLHHRRFLRFLEIITKLAMALIF